MDKEQIGFIFIFMSIILFSGLIVAFNYYNNPKTVTNITDIPLTTQEWICKNPIYNVTDNYYYCNIDDMILKNVS